MIDIKEVAENIYLIDNNLYSIPEYGATYFLDEAKKALIDVGPSTSSQSVLKGIRDLGFKPEDIKYIIVTHIHFDHAGGAGILMKEMPQAKLVVHSRGARHMINPERLLKSMWKTLGEEGITRNGEITPVRAEQVMAVKDNDCIKLSKEQVLTVIDAPGHAPHELCFYESRNGGIFSGDAAGNFSGEGIIEPLTPQPSFNLEKSIATLERLMALNANLIYFGHFGISDKVNKNLKLVIDKLKNHNDIIAASAENDFKQAAEKIIAQDRESMKPLRENMKPLYEHLTDVIMPVSVLGHIDYYKKAHNI
ncbi:MBL fold metallo-hydrolase [Chloroflexota bacterium]